jgi:Spherulation-specific family 4
MKKTNHALLAALAATAAVFASTAPAHAVELLVPAYFYPTSDPARTNYWTQLTESARAGAKITAILNPNSGPGDAVDRDYLAAINSFRDAGGTVLGYVYTCYGRNDCAGTLPDSRTVQDVLNDAAKYREWYGVSGVFLDEMSNNLSEVRFFEQVAAGLRRAAPRAPIFGNPGTAVPVEYLGVADTLVTFEQGAGNYNNLSTRQPWMDTEPANRQAHLHFNVNTEAQMRSLLAQAQRLNVGYVYITDDCYYEGDKTCTNPWNTLPSYWKAEVAAVTAVPELPTVWMALAGATALAWRVRRKAA